VLPPEVTADVLRIYNEEFSLPQIARGACAAVIGAVQKEKRYVLRTGNEIVMDVDIDFLTGQIEDELPFEDGATTVALRQAQGDTVVAPRGTNERDTNSDIDFNNCSREPLYKQYDAVVRGATVVPRNNDAGVMIVPGTSLGFALAVGGKPEPNADRALEAAYRAVVGAVCKVVAVGATPIGLTDCLNFGNPRKQQHYAQFVNAIEGLKRAATDLNLPFVSGNVSFYNESAHGEAIPASTIVACVGALSDISKVLAPAFKEAGSIIYGAGVDAIPHILSGANDGSIRACCVTFDGGVISAATKLAWGARAAGSRIGIRVDHATPEAFAFIVEADPSFGASRGVRKIGETIGEPHFSIAGKKIPLDTMLDQWSQPLTAVYQ